jgi:hypothetical protein
MIRGLDIAALRGLYFCTVTGGAQPFQDTPMSGFRADRPVMDKSEKNMNVTTLDRLVLQVTLLAGFIALVLLPW